MKRSPAAIDVLLVALGTGYAIWALRRAPSWAVDDAWIVVRYADHLAQLGRIAWNAEGPPVEGFTSLTAVVLAALGTLFHVAPMRTLDALGAVSFLASGILLLALGRALRAPAGAAGIVAIVHLTTAEHVTHATSGLETEMFIALALGLLLALADALRRPARTASLTAIVALLLATTRPEGGAAAVLALVALVVVRRGARRRLALRSALTWFVLPQLLLVGWRLARFGVPLPNTFYAKQGGWNLAHHRDLLFLLGAHAVDVAVVGGSAVLATWLLGRCPRRIGPRMVTVSAVAAGALGAQWLVYARSVPVMDYARRFAIHDAPWVLALALVGMSLALRAIGRLPRRLAGGFRLAVVLATVSATLRGRDALADEEHRMAVYADSSRSMVEPLAAWIAANTPARAVLAAYPDAGWTPTVTGRTTIDFGKLNDPYLARVARTTEDVVRYFFERQPDILVVSQLAPGKLYDSGADAIVADPRFAAAYELRLTRESAGGIAYRLYTRRP
ncbi:MAG: hypothetical protein JWP97_1873 [Labilithrix sp.]|nr:hypothetical protein [Labilithrix sp.]